MMKETLSKRTDIIMAKFDEIKRKHFRFPAYSDDTGVKIQSGRPAFSNDESWIITEESGTSSIYKEKTEERSLRRSPRVSHEKAGQSIQQREELERHRKHLPDYSKKYEPEVTSTGKKKLFGEHAQSTFKVNEKQIETPTPSLKKEYSGRSYFVPKYIPASMIPDEPVQEVSNQELMDSMKKESYLTFDTEPAAYQERKDTDPAVRKFKQPQPVSMSRSQYKEAVKSNRKRSVLDRSLKGMIEEGENEVGANGYFKK